MIIQSIQEFHEGDSISKLKLLDVDVIEIIESVYFDFMPGISSKAKTLFKDILKKNNFLIDTSPDSGLGWKIHAINRHGTAIQFEFGNSANAMYDVLKMAHLFRLGIVKDAIFILPMQINSKLIGSNIACYEKLEKEYALSFDLLFDTPIQIIGI